MKRMLTTCMKLAWKNREMLCLLHGKLGRRVPKSGRCDNPNLLYLHSECCKTLNLLKESILCFWTGFFFFLNLSFKIMMARQAGVGQAGGCWASSEVYLLVNLFQSCMLPFFFSGLLSYLVGMKRTTSRCVTCKRNYSFH